MLRRQSRSGSDTWAENGRIIYISCEMGVCNPHTSKDDGTGEKPIAITGFEDTPTISDNGKRIAFRQGGDIWVAKSDGTDLDNITDSPGVHRGGARHQPGREVDRLHRLRTARRATSCDPRSTAATSRPSSTSPTTTGAPEWSPDGKRVAFQRRYDGITSTTSMSVKKDGSDVDRLTKTASEVGGQPNLVSRRKANRF